MINSTPACRLIAINKLFSRENIINIEIKAEPKIIWLLLTTGSEYPKWNSTVFSFEGSFTKRGKIELKLKPDPMPIFLYSIREFERNKRLVWGNVLGKRVFTLTEIRDGVTNFRMSEKRIRLFPFFFAKKTLSFEEVFKQFATDLKKESELITMLREKNT